MPTNLGDWPLTIVVMVFSFAMFRLATAAINRARQEYSGELSAQRAEHQKSTDEQRRAFTETLNNVITKMTEEIGHLAKVTDAIETRLVDHDVRTMTAFARMKPKPTRAKRR